MNLRIVLVSTAAIMPLCVLAAPTKAEDEKALRDLYSKIDEAYAKRDAKTVISMMAPKCFALLNNSIIFPSQMKQSIVDRFRKQTQCERHIQPVNIEIRQNVAFVDSEGEDSYTYKREEGMRSEIQHRKERTQWVRTKDGWKQEHVRILEYKWKIAGETQWRDAMPKMLPKPKV